MQAASTALSAELATILRSLSEAAAILASAEALADTAAAFTSELAAAQVAAAAAQAIEKAGPDSPSQLSSNHRPTSHLWDNRLQQSAQVRRREFLGLSEMRGLFPNCGGPGVFIFLLCMSLATFS